MINKPEINMVEVMKYFNRTGKFISHAVDSYVNHLFDSYEIKPHQKMAIDSAVSNARKNLVTSFQMVELDPMPLIRAMSGK